MTATVTLNNVSITGVEENSATGAPAQSPIDLADGATLILILAESSTNTLTGGAGTSFCGAPGIHVPDNAALIIQGSGSLSVSGGSYRDGYGARGLEERLILQVRHQATTRAKIAARSSFCQVKV